MSSALEGCPGSTGTYSSRAAALLLPILQQVFDNITHAHILDSISELGLSDTFHKFVSSFLRSRKATLKIGDLKSDPVGLGPKGAVISLLLFNIAMCKLSKLLSIVEGINHTPYADDITIWCVSGSEGEVESAPQEALDQTEHFLTNTGLKCSSTASQSSSYTGLPGGGPNQRAGCRCPKLT